MQWNPPTFNDLYDIKNELKKKIKESGRQVTLNATLRSVLGERGEGRSQRILEKIYFPYKGLTDAEADSALIQRLSIALPLVEVKPPKGLTGTIASILDGGNEWDEFVERIVLMALFVINQAVVDINLEEEGRSEDRIDKTKGADLALKSKVRQKAVLALIVPSKRLGAVNLGHLSIEQASSLISDAIYFRCTTVDHADEKEKSLDLSSEPLNLEERDVYLRIEIEDCASLIGETIRLKIKNSLPEHEIKLTKFATLGRPTGLGDFIRI